MTPHPWPWPFPTYKGEPLRRPARKPFDPATAPSAPF